MSNNERIENIEGYPDYFITSCGRVWSYKTNKFLKPRKDKNGYFLINLYKDGVAKTFLIHKLVALAYIPNPDNKPTIDHICRDKENNCVNNLRWADYSEQNTNRTKSWEHSIETKLPVLCVETGKKFDNSAAAAHWIVETGLSNSDIYHIAEYLRKTCNNKYCCKTAYGYHWNYAEEGAE